MKRILTFVMILLMLASLIACGDKENETAIRSENAITSAFANILEQISESGGYISVSTQEDFLSAMGAEMKGLSISGFDIILDKNKAEIGIIGKYNKKDITDTFFLSDTALVVNAPVLLGGAYGIDLSTLQDDWNSSYLNPKNGSEYAIPQDVCDTFSQLLVMLKGNSASILPGVDAEKVSNTITKFTKNLMAEMEKAIPVSQKSDGKYTTKTIKITLDNIGKLLDAFETTLNNDKEFQSVIQSILSASGSEEISAIQFTQLLESLRVSINTYAANTPAGAEFNIVLSYKYSKDNMDKTYMIGIEIKQDGESATLAFGLKDLMTNGKKDFTHNISTDFNCTGYFKEMLVNDAEFAEILSALKSFQYKTVWNKQSGALQIKISAMDHTVTLDANMKFNATKNGKTELVFVFEKLYADELFDSQDVIKSPITLKLSTDKPKTLSVPKYENILKNEQTFKKITAYLEKEFSVGFGESDKESAPDNIIIG